MQNRRSVTAASSLPQDRTIAEGWTLIVTAAAGFITLPTTLPVYSIGVLTAPLHEAFGWPRAQIQAALFFSTGLGVLCAPVVGYLISTIGSRRLIISGLVGMALGFTCAARTPASLWQFYLAYSIMSVLGAGAGAITWSRLIAGAFVKRRGFALGLALSGTGLSAILGPLFTAFLVTHVGWRGAYLGLALVPLTFALPLALCFVPKTTAAGNTRITETTDIAISGVTVGEAIASYRFWALATSITLVYFALSGLIAHLTPLLTDRGVSSQHAATIASVIGPAIIISRTVLGLLFDRYWGPAVGVATLLPAAAACLMLRLDLDLYGYVGCVALIGVATGVELDILSYLTARYFGLYRYARLYGWIFASYSLFSGLAPAAFGRLYDISHDYLLVLNTATVLFSIGALLLLTLGRYPALPLHLAAEGLERTHP